MVDLKKVRFFLINKDTSDFKLFKPFCSTFSKTRQLKERRKMPRKTNINIATHTHYCYVSNLSPMPIQNGSPCHLPLCSSTSLSAGSGESYLSQLTEVPTIYRVPPAEAWSDCPASTHLQTV